MMRLFHWAAAALLLLCGWLTGSAFQVRTEQHILQLQRTVELLQRIRQEIAYRRLDLEQLQRCLVQEKLLESDAAPKLQEIPAPERFDDAERLCFEDCPCDLKCNPNCAANNDEQLQNIVQHHDASPLPRLRTGEQTISFYVPRTLAGGKHDHLRLQIAP